MRRRWPGGHGYTLLEGGVIGEGDSCFSVPLRADEPVMRAIDPLDRHRDKRSIAGLRIFLPSLSR
jgi:hypothetical protein